MKDVGRWLPQVPPGSTGRFYKDVAVHNHSAHRYYVYNPHIETGKICLTMLHVTVVHTRRGLDLVTFHIKYYLSYGTSKINVISKVPVDRTTPNSTCQINHRILIVTWWQIHIWLQVGLSRKTLNRKEEMAKNRWTYTSKTFRKTRRLGIQIKLSGRAQQLTNVAGNRRTRLRYNRWPGI